MASRIYQIPSRKFDQNYFGNKPPMKTPEEMMQEENLQFYAANLAAWFSTRLEYDKSLLVLSTGGVGLLLTLFTTFGANSLLLLVLYALAALSFLAAAVCLLIVYRLNTDHIEDVVRDSHKPADDVDTSPDSAKGGALISKKLFIFDQAVIALFAIGLASSVSIGFVAGYSSYLKKLDDRKPKMANESNTKGAPVFDSVNGIGNMQPKVLAQKSFNGMANLAPKAIANSATPASSAQPAPQASAAVPASAAPTKGA